MIARYVCAVATAMLVRTSALARTDTPTCSRACDVAAHRDAASTGTPNVAVSVPCVSGVVTTSLNLRSCVDHHAENVAIDRGHRRRTHLLQQRFGPRIPSDACATVGLFFSARWTASSSVTDSIAGGV